MIIWWYKAYKINCVHILRITALFRYRHSTAWFMYNIHLYSYTILKLDILSLNSNATVISQQANFHIKCKSPYYSWFWKYYNIHNFLDSICGYGWCGSCRKIIANRLSLIQTVLLLFFEPSTKVVIHATTILYLYNCVFI